MAQLKFKNALSKLDASMVRCSVAFIFSYRFKGAINIEQLDNSINTIIGNVVRFQQQILLQKNYQAQWQPQSLQASVFSVQEVNHLDKALVDNYHDVANNEQLKQQPAMFFVLYIDKSQANEFAILQCGKHSYCDGKSAIFLFNQILQHYSAVLCGDLVMQQNIINNICSLYSPAPNDIYALCRTSQRLMNIGRWQHIKNTLRLMTYKISDKAQYATSHKQLPAQLKQFQSTHSAPLIRKFDISALVHYCNLYCPDVSPHNMVCALVAKATYTLNCEVKNLPSAHSISFRVMVDILNAPMRKQCIGNYIAYLPVTVDGRMLLHQIASAINQRLFKARQNREDISMYKLLEFALGSGMANKNNDPVSYIIANIDNISLTHNPHRLHGATYQRFDVTANATPLDLGGAQLNNRPTLCFNLAADNQLMLSFFNTVTDVQTQVELLARVDTELNKLMDSTSKTATIPAGV